jgi:hypothetical protein
MPVIHPNGILYYEIKIPITGDNIITTIERKDIIYYIQFFV